MALEIASLTTADTGLNSDDCHVNAPTVSGGVFCCGSAPVVGCGYVVSLNICSVFHYTA